MTIARTLLLLLALLGAPTPLLAAAPTLTCLYPAGARRGTSAEVTVSGMFDRWPVAVAVHGRGITARPAKERGKLLVTVASDADPGPCWVRLYNDDGASVARPFLVGLLPEVVEKEPNNEPGQAQPLSTASVLVNGRLEKPGDVDTFAVSLRRGQTLVAAVEAHKTLRSPMDAVLQIVSPDGFVLAQSDDYHDLDPLLAFTAPADGTFLVRLFAFPAVPDASIRFTGGETHVYRLTLTTSGFVDYPFPLSIAADQPGAVELVGWNLPADARRLTVPAAGNTGRALLLNPALANAVEVRREPHAALVLRQPTSRTAPLAIPLPATITSRLDRPGAMDVYQFAGRKGQALVFRVESQSLDFDMEPVLRLTDRAGKQLARAEAAKLHSDATLSFKPPQDGTYLLEVQDLHGAGGRRHVYRLSAGPPMPEFALTVATERFTLTPGTPLTIPVTVERRAGFAADITLTVEGPAGVTVSPLTAGAKDKTVNLKLTAGAAVSGPLRVIGKAGGIERAAQANVAELGRSMDQLWLTVRKAPTK